MTFVSPHSAPIMHRLCVLAAEHVLLRSQATSNLVRESKLIIMTHANFFPCWRHTKSAPPHPTNSHTGNPTPRRLVPHLSSEGISQYNFVNASFSQTPNRKHSLPLTAASISQGRRSQLICLARSPRLSSFERSRGVRARTWGVGDIRAVIESGRFAKSPRGGGAAARCSLTANRRGCAVDTWARRGHVCRGAARFGMQVREKDFGGVLAVRGSKAKGRLRSQP